MPELPEVEVIVRSLDKLVSNRKIIAAELLRARLAPFDPPDEFARRLKDSTIKSVHRRGKHILFDLDNARTLITHLRMSGRFMLLSVEHDLPKFAHAIFYFADETRLVFKDQRHFGLMKIVETANLHETKELKKLAPEPFSEEFDSKYLRAVLRNSKRPLKLVLLDQTKVLGLGNIYASEALFLARLNPQTLAGKVSAKKAGVLHEMIREVLRLAIANISASGVNHERIDESYFDSENEGGWHVYDRENEPCTNCKTPILRIRQGGRSTYFCPRCQK
jgi:formamidopyrimidine-DNA glycosylase